MAHVVVAGGSMPLNANNLIQTLGRSLLPNQIELTASKEQLETWESRSEYIPALLVSGLEIVPVFHHVLVS
jgi:hypothetical protein